MLSKKMLVMLLTFVSFCGFAASDNITASRAESGWQKIKQGALLVDVRTAQEFEAQHLENAINIPLHTIGTAFQHINKEKEIVVYCRSGNRSGQAEHYLKQVGFKHVHNAGGLQEMLAVK